MPREPQYGSPVAKADVGPRMVPSLPVARATTPPIEWRKHCLNGYAPSAQFQNLLNEATNQAVVMRTRQIFAAISHPNEMAASSSSQPTYRFAFRTGSYHSSLVAFATMQPPLGANGDNASYARLKIFSDTNEATTVSTTDFYYGASPNGVAFTQTRGWSFAKTIKMFATGLTPDTNYYALFSSESAGCLQTATVIEMQSMTQHFDGYLPTSLNQDSEVLSIYREKVATIQQNLWKHSGQHLINFTISDGTLPLTRASSTAVNVVDNSSTSVSAATPGYTLDMTNRVRVGQASTGVPVIMKVFCQTTDASQRGRIYLKDSAGATVMSISGSIPLTSPRWVTTTGLLPASSAKYDLHFDNGGGGTISLYAVSIWEYES